MCMRPATPGFLVTLIATILLAVVSFNVPIIKSIYFLKASLSVEQIDGSITFGTLGYCMQLPNGTTCSKPAVGYELNINELVGNKLPLQIPNVLVKWLTYALVLHIVALILAAASAVFGLLAHVREMSMTCCSTCVSGFAAVVTMIAFIFDIAFFFIAKSRLNAVQGGSASMGIAIWLTLAAWVLLFFAGCFYGFGRCCASRRPRGDQRNGPKVNDRYAEEMRLDAVKAEADRKARQARGEIGLPAFQEFEQAQPLTKHSEEFIEDGDQIVPYNAAPTGPTAGVGAGAAAYARQGAPPPNRQQTPYAGGYSQAPVGTRAVDDFYGNAAPSQPAYPPQPRRQGSGYTQNSSVYAPSPSPGPTAAVATAGVAAAVPGSQYLAYGHSQSPTAATQNYGHPERSNTYQSATSQHQSSPSNYSSQYPDPYGNQGRTDPSFNPDIYNNTAYMSSVPAASAYPTHDNAYVAQPTASHPERSYTLGGDGYGSNAVSAFEQQAQNDNAAYYPHYPTNTSAFSTAPAMPNYHSPSPPAQLNTNVSPLPMPQPTSPRGPRPLSQPHYDDNPPMYDASTAQPAGVWGVKH